MFFSHASQLNIFFLDKNPQMCAFAHCDDHIREMIPVYSQILSNAHHILDPEGDIIEHIKPLDPSYPNVQMEVQVAWVKDNRGNYQWLHDLWFWMNKEYWYRFDGMHDDWNTLYNKLSHTPQNIPDSNFTSPSPLVPEEFKEDQLEDDFQNVIAGYRKFYRWWVDNNDCEWSAPEGATRTAPDWIIREEETIDANV